MKDLLTHTVLVMMLVGSALAGSSDRVRVQAAVNTETAIYPGDTFQYSIVVEGGAKPSKIDISPLKAFRPLPAGDGTSYQQFNDQVSITYSSNYQITATDVGTMHLPGVTVVVNGQTYTTNEVDVTISKPGTTDRMSVEFSVAEKKCYAGQPIVMTVRWIVSSRWQNVAFDVPVFTSPDFLIEEVSAAASAPAEQVVIDGVPTTVRGNRQNIKGMESEVYGFTKVIIPQRAGRIKLDPVTVSANLAVGRVRTNSLLNPYMMDYKRMSVQSEPVELEVLPLPEEGKPAEFYGLVGQYTIEASAAPTKVSVGDPITVTIRVGGNPYLKPVQWPQLEQVPELAANFKIPAEKASPTIENGQKVFTQTLRANSDAVKQVPPIPLAYFDPQSGQYVVARTGAIPLEVSPTKILTNADMEGTGGESANGTGAARVSPVQAINKGLSANYYGPEILDDQSFSLRSAVFSPRYAAVWSIPLLGLLASAVVRLAGRTSPESVARKRRRQAAGLATRRLNAAASAGKRGHSTFSPASRSAKPVSDEKAECPLFASEQVLAAMKGYIGDRFDRVAASLTADDCRDVIVQATGDSAVASRYRDLIAACEADRYAPLATEIGSDQVREATELIDAIERCLQK
ncbi:MAG: BatD family protein [Phycisphaerales bacterium]